MIQGSDHSNRGEVMCLFCGHHTVALATARNISLVRCQACGKEAPYLVSEIVAFEHSAKTT
jgi:transcription elongation factor Elf1